MRWIILNMLNFIWTFFVEYDPHGFTVLFVVYLSDLQNFELALFFDDCIYTSKNGKP